MDTNIRLLEDERIDDLECSGLKIIQNTKKFCFGIDAVLLSGFTAERDLRGACLLDVGTGTGILPLLLSAKTQAVSITGLEIQPESAEMAARSVEMNRLQEKIRIVCGDIKEADRLFGRASFDVLTCNPPYIKASSGLVNPGSAKAIARHEVACTFEDIAKQAAVLLKTGGRLFLVHRPQRLAEVIYVLRKYRLEPKRLRMVHSFADTEAALFLLEALSGGGTELRVEKPLVIYHSPGVYTEEIKAAYGY